MCVCVCVPKSIFSHAAVPSFACLFLHRRLHLSHLSTSLYIHTWINVFSYSTQNIPSQINSTLFPIPSHPIQLHTFSLYFFLHQSRKNSVNHNTHKCHLHRWHRLYIGFKILYIKPPIGCKSQFLDSTE